MESTERLMIFLWRLVISFIVIIMASDYVATIAELGNHFIIGIFVLSTLFVGVCMAYFGLLYQKKGIEQLKQTKKK